MRQLQLQDIEIELLGQVFKKRPQLIHAAKAADTDLQVVIDALGAAAFALAVKVRFYEQEVLAP